MAKLSISDMGSLMIKVCSQVLGREYAYIQSIQLNSKEKGSSFHLSLKTVECKRVSLKQINSMGSGVELIWMVILRSAFIRMTNFTGMRRETIKKMSQQKDYMKMMLSKARTLIL